MKNSIDISKHLSSLDWIVFTTILLITLSIVLYQHINKSKKDNLLEILLMGRRLTLPLFVSTMVATWYGGIFGVTQIAFEKGIYNFITQGFFWYLSYIIFAFVIVKKIKSYNSVTVPELISKLFGKRSAQLSAIFNFFSLLPIVNTISIGIFIQSLFNFPLYLSTLIGTSIVILYSFFGGFRAIVLSDTVQSFVMCCSVFSCFSFLIF